MSTEKVDPATDEEVAEMKQRHQKTALYERCNDCWYGKWPCPTAKLLARLERVEEELETNLFAATATVASLEDKLATVERERLSWEKLAGSFTHSQHQYLREMEQLRVEIASVKHSRDRLREALRKTIAPLRDCIAAWEHEGEPSAIGYEMAVEGAIRAVSEVEQALKEG